MSHLPIALQVAFVAGLLALLGTVLTRSIARSQLEVSRQTLFVSLLPRRIEWLDKFRKAVSDWDSQMMTIIHYEGNDPPEPVALFELGRLIQEATWLFGEDVARSARAIDIQLEKVRDLRIQAMAKTAGSLEAGMKVGSTLIEVYRLFEPLHETIKPMLYVGDIENRAGLSRWWKFRR